MALEPITAEEAEEMKKAHKSVKHKEMSKQNTSALVPGARAGGVGMEMIELTCGVVVNGVSGKKGDPFEVLKSTAVYLVAKGRAKYVDEKKNK